MVDSKKSNRTSKTGVPLLTHNDDLTEIFTGEKSKRTPEKSFTEMMESSLSEQTIRTALREKNDTLLPEKALTINEKIKDYPDPEDQIDLHGCSADEAAVRTESFIQAARRKGARTVRIIAGKGLHSEEKAVLPHVVEDKIVDLKKNKLVLTFKWEKKSKLKSGAVIVYLSSVL